MLTYLFLNIGTIFFPLIRSFEPKINYYQKWPFLFAGIITAGVFFIIWDHFFTIHGVWSFNPDYILGVYWLGLPMEEWLFFITVPFACVFIYEATKLLISGDPLKPYANLITWILIPAFLIISLLNIEKWYTFLNFLFASTFLLIHWLVFGKKYLGNFYLAYLFHLVPFFIVNGILTYLPVVIYNNTENLGIRIGSIPVEDTVYSMLLLLMNITFFEGTKNLAGVSKSQNLKDYVKS